MVDVPSKGYQPIENYGIIGALAPVALVGMDGSIDFRALPHFDSPTVFAALFAWHKGGRFQMAQGRAVSDGATVDRRAPATTVSPGCHYPPDALSGR
jgi:trehalase-like protein